MSIKRILCAKGDLKTHLLPVLNEDFGLDAKYTEFVYREYLQRPRHIENLIDTIWILIESPYIDKVYRDCYYTYFSSKSAHYKKECIRLSFFNGEIKAEEFTTESNYKSLQDRYLGFMILRPTDPKIIGRSTISPKAVSNNNFLCITAPVQATANSIKFSVNGFPHSSQDTETITCAETTLWAIMEYFGNKYPEYKPVLPSMIINGLKKVSAERQVPSKGLNIQQMAFTLKEFGFGTKVYARDEFGKNEFNRLFSTYIESGIPIIVAMSNRHIAKGDIAHALLCIGHERTDDSEIDSLKESQDINSAVQQQLQTQGVTLFDNDDLERRFVFIDDNLPIYQLNKLNSPANHYPETKWHTCEINYFIAPLYPKIYLEAFEAKGLFKRTLLDFFTIKNEEIFLRFFLTSSRSFKHNLSFNASFDPTIREMILETEMPKFLWIGEVSTKALIKQRKANGIVILDATEANLQSLKALIVAAYKGQYISYDTNTNWFTNNSLPLGDFDIYTNNLNGF
ncbi:MAG: hypothetical protein KF860_14835 [Cyclobacteriaceae bacterium]|nr:hypothetical protein [Cyclobacteriaceae bacterium]